MNPSAVFRFSSFILRGRSAPRGRTVVLLEILPNHPVRVELRADGGDRVLHAPEPPAREAGPVARVELRDDSLREQVVDAVGVVAVLLREALKTAAVADGPAIDFVERFRPPAVEDRAIEAAVQRRLHAAGAAGLLRAQRV